MSEITLTIPHHKGIECLESFSACFQSDFPFEAQANFIHKLATEMGVDDVPPVERIVHVSLRTSIKAQQCDLIFEFWAFSRKWVLNLTTGASGVQKTQHLYFVSNLRKMFSYVGSTAKNYSELLKVIGASLDDQKAFVDTLTVPAPINAYADKIVAALQDGDEEVIREFISAIGGVQAQPDTCDKLGFLVQWNTGAGTSVFGVVTEHSRSPVMAYLSVILLNKGEHLRILDDSSASISFPVTISLSTLMRASAIMMNTPFKFAVSIPKVISQTQYDWNGD